MLKEYRADPGAAKKKWTGKGTEPDPWIKLTGVYDGKSTADTGIVLDGIVLKGTGPDAAEPNRVFLDVPGVHQPLVKELKPGQQVTVRVCTLGVDDKNRVRFLGAYFPLPE